MYLIEEGEAMEILFDLPLRAAPASGLSATLLSVDQAMTAVSALLASGVLRSVQWRYAGTMLRLASAGKCRDISVVRRSLSDALDSDGWLISE